MSLANKTLIFDFDGVVADTYDLHVDLWHRWGLPKKIARSFLDSSCNNSGTGFTPPLKKYFDLFFYYNLKRYYTKQNKNLLFENVIDTLKVTPHPKFLVSMGSRSYVSLVLGDMLPIFEDLIGRFQMKGGKKIGVKQLMDAHNLKPDDVVLFTDTVRDIVDFKALVPEHSIYAVDWGFCSHKALLKELPEERILNKHQFRILITT